jgi:hypothetical protein
MSTVSYPRRRRLTVLRLEPTLRDHPKLRRLSVELGVSRPEALGWLLAFWHWCLLNAPDGRIAGCTASVIAMAVDWNRERRRSFLHALITAGFVEPDGSRLHHWWRGRHAIRGRHPVRIEWDVLAPKLRPQVFARDGYRCVICGSTDDLSVDHVLPIARGGTNDEWNLQTACMRCNRLKGAS